MENQVQGGNRRASFHQSTLSSEDMLGLLAPVDSNILVLDSQRRHRNTSLNSLKRLLELSKHNKVLTEAFYDVSLQKGGFCSIKFLQAWVLGCLCKARQKLASFRDTYVPHAFAVMDELEISYPEDARVYVKNLIRTLGKQRKVSCFFFDFVYQLTFFYVKKLLPSQISDPVGAEPILNEDIEYALSGVNSYALGWNNCAITACLITMLKTSGHRFVTVNGVQFAHIKVESCEQNENGSFVKVGIYYTVTKGEDPNFAHWHIYEGYLNYFDRHSLSCVVFWLHAYLRRIGYHMGLLSTKLKGNTGKVSRLFDYLIIIFDDLMINCSCLISFLEMLTLKKQMGISTLCSPMLVTPIECSPLIVVDQLF